MRLLLVAALAGCGAPPAPTAPASTAPVSVFPPGPPALLLGGVSGDGAFTALSDGAELPLEAGAQGGFHVWVQARLRDVPPMRARVTRTGRRVSDGALVLRATTTLDLPAGVERPTPMFMCPTPIGLSVVDQAVRLEITLADEGERPIASGALTVIARCPAGEQRDFCLRICTG